MSLPTRCPSCHRTLVWYRIDVDAGSDGERPDEATQCADCECGLGMTWELWRDYETDAEQPELFA